MLQDNKSTKQTPNKKKSRKQGKTEEEELQAEIILDHVYDFVKGTTTSESFI